MGNIFQDLQGNPPKIRKEQVPSSKQLVMKEFTDSFFAYNNTPKKIPEKTSKKTTNTSYEFTEEEKMQIQELFGQQDIA